jgi:hypothetical protein
MFILFYLKLVLCTGTGVNFAVDINTGGVKLAVLHLSYRVLPFFRIHFEDVLIEKTEWYS